MDNFERHFFFLILKHTKTRLLCTYTQKNTSNVVTQAQLPKLTISLINKNTNKYLQLFPLSIPENEWKRIADIFSSFSPMFRTIIVCACCEKYSES